MKVTLPREIIERFLICIEYAEHNCSCNEGTLLKNRDVFLKIPNCPYLGKCFSDLSIGEPIAEVVKAFKKALRSHVSD